MHRISRRKFIKSGAAVAVFKFVDMKAEEKIIHLTTDGLNLTPLEYCRLLTGLAEERKIEPDNYSLGGAVEELETEFAKLLGKESAIVFPTGTLANTLAIRVLSTVRITVIVQR